MTKGKANIKKTQKLHTTCGKRRVVCSEHSDLCLVNKTERLCHPVFQLVQGLLEITI